MSLWHQYCSGLPPGYKTTRLLNTTCLQKASRLGMVGQSQLKTNEQTAQETKTLKLPKAIVLRLPGSAQAE